MAMTRGITMDWAAPFYERMCGLYGLGPAFRARTLELLSLHPGERVLDAGCGTGIVTRMAAEAVGPSGRAIGIDPGPGMLAQAKRRAVDAGSRAQFRLAAAEDLPFEDESFDAAVMSLVLHHLPSDVKDVALREILRVLKAGGRLLLVDLDRPRHPAWWLVIWPLWLLPTVRPHLRGQVAERLARAGYAGVEVRGGRGGLLTFWFAKKHQGG